MKAQYLIPAVLLPLLSSVPAMAWDLEAAGADAVRSVEAPPPAGVKIVGGVSAAAGEFPFVVSVRSGGHSCGGSLIDREWVLTAAHCVDEESVDAVALGMTGRDDLGAAEVIAPARVVVHPRWDPGDMDYDLALIKLAAPSSARPVALYRGPRPFLSKLVTAGWGDLDEGSGEGSSVLMKTEVPYVDRATCSAAYPGLITPRMICAGYASGGHNSCQGDSGGPLLAGYGHGARLAGVVSWSKGCARPGLYGVFADAASAADWIDSVISAGR